MAAAAQGINRDRRAATHLTLETDSLNRLAKFLEGQGRRVQESVFECFGTLDEMQRLHRQVLCRTHPTEDNVRFYWIPAGAMAKALTIGSDPTAPSLFSLGIFHGFFGLWPLHWLASCGADHTPTLHLENCIVTLTFVDR